MPDREYFATEMASASGTKVLLSGTNAHLAHEMEHPPEETDAFALGSLVHARILQPETIEENFIVTPKIDRRTKDGKAAWESIQRRASLSGARIVTDEQVAEATAIAESVLAHGTARKLLDAATLREVAVLGPVAGHAAKAKFDAVSYLDGPKQAVILDVKTAASASPKEFASACARFGYAHQAAFYRRILSHYEIGVEDFIFIVVEKTPPHLVACYRLPDAAIEVADRRIDEVVRRWYEVRHGDRTGYPEGISTVEMPTWWMLNEEN